MTATLDTPSRVLSHVDQHHRLLPPSTADIDTPRDWDTLLIWFRNAGAWISRDQCAILGLHNHPEHLVKLGWIRPVTNGRWSQGYAPAGPLLADLAN